MKRRRVLVSAFACSPIRGSEAAVGWQLCTRLGRYHDITVLYSTNDHYLPYQQEVESYLDKYGPVPAVTFHAVPHPWLSRACQRLHNAGLWATYYAGYRAWQKEALTHARRMHAAKPFDVVHQMNMIGYREPGYLWQLGAPFVWGPVGGASNMPWKYFSQLSWRGRLSYGARNIINPLQMRVAVRARSAARSACHVWAANADNMRMISSLWGYPAENMIETGTTPRNVAPRSYNGQRPLSLCWSGQHTGGKALPILLKAMSRVASVSDVKLTVLGKGPETARWQAQAQRLGISSRIYWAGYLPHDDALQVMDNADVFVFTSLQEGTPHVVLESLSLGLPVVCHDACGMGIAVTEQCGIKVPIADLEQSVTGFASAIIELFRDPHRVRQLSAGALQRAAQLSWDEKAKHIAEEYTCCAERGGLAAARMRTR